MWTLRSDCGLDGLSQDNTLGLCSTGTVCLGAVRAVRTAVGMTSSPIGVAMRSTTFAASWLPPGTLVALAAKLADDFEKGLFHVYAILGRRFDEITAQLLGQGAAFLGGDLAFCDTVALVADKHHGSGTQSGTQGRRGQGRAGVGGRAGERRFLDALNLVVKALDAGKGRA